MTIRLIGLTLRLQANGSCVVSCVPPQRQFGRWLLILGQFSNSPRIFEGRVIFHSLPAGRPVFPGCLFQTG